MKLTKTKKGKKIDGKVRCITLIWENGVVTGQEVELETFEGKKKIENKKILVNKDIKKNADLKKELIKNL